MRSRPTRGIDGTPIQRISRPPTKPNNGLFTEQEIKHITKPPTPLKKTISHVYSTITILTKKILKFSLHFIRRETTRLPRRVAHLRHLPIHQLFTLAIGMIITALAVAIAYTIVIKPRASTPSPSAAPQSYSHTANNPLPKGNPSYTTMTPDGRSYQWSRVSPSTSDPVYAYTDTIDGISIIVSQQPLPETFKSNTRDKIKDLASSYSAGEHLTLDSTDIYIGKSSGGQQSIVLTKNNLLILIKTNALIDHGKLLQYIQSLK